MYLVFDHISMPNEGDDTFYKCYNNYISVSSQNRPEEYYRLCGNRKGVKLITTYNNVLINFVTNSIRDFVAGFSLVYKIISDPSARN